MDVNEVLKDPSALWAAVRREVERTGAAPQAITREMAEALLRQAFEHHRAANEAALQVELRDLPLEDRRKREARRSAERAESLLRQDLEVRECAAELEDTYLREELKRVPFPRGHSAAAQEQLAATHLLEDAETLLRHEQDLDWHHAYWASQSAAGDQTGAAIREECREDDEDRLYYLHSLELDNLKTWHKVETIRLGISLQERDDRSRTMSEDPVSSRSRKIRQQSKGMGWA